MFSRCAMKYLVLVLNDGMSRVEQAILCSDGDVDLRCHEVLSPSLASSPVPTLPAAESPLPPPELSPVFPPSPPPLVNPEAESVLRQYRRELLERSLLCTADSQRRNSCPCERLPVRGEEDECLGAVNLLFPDALLEAAERGYDIFKSPSVSPQPWLDLSSYDSDVEEMSSHFSLDCPEEPGKGCSSCGFHRSQSGVAGAMCSLCYMRQTYHCIYSECS